MILNLKTLGHQIVGKPKDAGKLDGKKVLSVLTKGGLTILCTVKANDDLNVLGAGSHGAIARMVAKNANPSIEFTELSKSDALPADILARYLPQFTELTQTLQAEVERTRVK